ncbi:hypothetical protein ACKI1J_42725 [Streptomyces scabiei]|uniref:hypothetical protein n=1 Tax=Streptomyces scabiei TaxID=1930 RepID=UPI0038F655F3
MAHRPTQSPEQISAERSGSATGEAAMVICWACASQYMHLSGRPLQPKDDDLYELARAIRRQEADLRTVAQCLESWRSE